jgi:hypothetical protein
MLNILKKIFHNPDKETINIFEKKTKIDYSPTIFSSLKVISLTDSKLKNLNPLLVFINLEILNLSNNKIKDMDFLKKLTKLRIIDLRFNKIEKIPSWVFQLGKNIYWKREDEEQEGIFLEGNPLEDRIILKIKNHSNKKKLPLPIVQKQEKKAFKPTEVEKLIPLKRQHLAIFSPQSNPSTFIDNFLDTTRDNFKLNISTLNYSNNYKIVNSNQQIFKDLQYIILLLKEAECCLNPPILETLSKLYIKSKIFLIIENSDKKNMQEKITFFKTYSKSINIIEVYHASNKKSHDFIIEEIYQYLQNTQEANTLWRKNWITLRDKIEESKTSNIKYKDFFNLAQKYSISENVIDDIFLYLKKVGSIKEYETKEILVHG